MPGAVPSAGPAWAAGRPHIVAIGGGELAERDTLALDAYIARATGKPHPRALFLPTASGDAEGYCDAFRRIYADELGCSVEVLRLAREPEGSAKIAQKLAAADLIYVGGGHSRRMLDLWRDRGVDDLLRRAASRGALLSGLSAGALCWFRYGNSDSPLIDDPGRSARRTMRVEGLGLVNIAFCPHMIREAVRWEELPEMMRQTPGVCVAVDDHAALEVRGGQFRVLAARPGVRAHLAGWEGAHWRVQPLETVAGAALEARGDGAGFRPLGELSLPGGRSA